ncbi:MAG: non-heme iron oxygenase ferredoxin subunit [Anaerolineae bacterium]|nr:non-heme iron oxygenase ferredoxin subunit [Anaerolineae bacterium]
MTSEFITVATTSEIPLGERIVVEIGRRWIAIFNVDGQYYAIEDRCTHDDGPLAEGELHDCIIECPRHGATFDIRTGKVLSAPALVDVPAFTVRVNNDEIQIGPRKS